MKSLKRYWQECRERGVVAAVIVYAVAGFVVLLVSDVLALAVPLPAWLRPLILKTVLLGLPVTVIVSWLYNYRREVWPVGGRDLDAVWEDERTRKSSHLKSAGIVAGILGAIVLWGAFENLRSPRVNTVAARVAIAPFENATSDSTLDALGGLAADQLAARLMANRELRIVPYSSAVAYTTAVPPRPGLGYERAIQVARGVNANYVVWGSYYLIGDTLLFSGQVSDATSGDLVANINGASASVRDPTVALARFRENVARVVSNLLRAERSAGARSLASIPHPGAHGLYTDALRHYVAADYRGAIDRLREVEQTDSGFIVARIWLARVLAESGDMRTADSLSRALEPYRARLDPYDRAQLDYAQAFSRYDLSLRYGASTLMTMIAPPSDDAQRLLALDALAYNHPREARSVLLGLDPAKGWLRSWPDYYAALAAAYHLNADYHAEERIVIRGLQRHPHSLDLWVADCRARAALAKTDRDWWRIRFIMNQPGQRNGITVGNALTRCSEELLAHGQARHARYADSLAIRWFQTAGQDVPAQLRTDYALALSMVGRPDLAYAEMKRILELPMRPADKPLMQARTAYFAAVAGQRQEAFVFDSTANAGTDRYPNPYVTLERARVSAALGDTQTAYTLMDDALSHGVPFAEPSAVLLHADVMLRQLWQLPSFKALLQPGG